MAFKFIEIADIDPLPLTLWTWTVIYMISAITITITICTVRKGMVIINIAAVGMRATNSGIVYSTATTIATAAIATSAIY
jgi:hypothetical protein